MTPITKNILLFIFARSCVGVAKLLYGVEFTTLFVELVIKTIAILLESNILIFRRH